MTDKKDEVSYSKIISVKTLSTFAAAHIWPNPSNDKINFSLKADRDNIYHYSIYNLSGGLVKNGNLPVKKGHDDIFL
jgi:hypothetical protein